MDNLKPPKNFTLSRESMKATLDAFKAGKTVANVTGEVFQAVAHAAAIWTTTPTLAPTLAFVPAIGSSQSVASRASIPAKVPTSSKSPAASRKPIVSASLPRAIRGRALELSLSMSHLFKLWGHRDWGSA